MTAKQIESAAQDEAVTIYRDAFGYPRLVQPDEPSPWFGRVVALVFVATCVGFAITVIR